MGYTGFRVCRRRRYATFMNGYNNQVYSVGRGPSKTTVTAPDIGITTDTPITITGSVIDISAGTTQSQQASDFPNGVPCASDASMQAWMGYVYQQQPEPTNFTGVQVQLAVLDSNGNHYAIGTATTDQSGTYSLRWTPDIQETLQYMQPSPAPTAIGHHTLKPTSTPGHLQQQHHRLQRHLRA